MFFIKLHVSMISGYLMPGFTDDTFSLGTKDEAELFVTRQEAEEVLARLRVNGEVEN